MTTPAEAAVLTDPEVVPSGRRRAAGTSWRFFSGKLVGAASSLLFMLVTNFFLFRVIPSDPVRTLARGRATTPEQVAELTKTLGLEQPLPQQFLTYLGNTFTGEFGV